MISYFRKAQSKSTRKKKSNLGGQNCPPSPWDTRCWEMAPLEFARPSPDRPMRRRTAKQIFQPLITRDGYARSALDSLTTECKAPEDACKEGTTSSKMDGHHLPSAYVARYCSRPMSMSGYHVDEGLGETQAHRPRWPLSRFHLQARWSIV